MLQPPSSSKIPDGLTQMKDGHEPTQAQRSTTGPACHALARVSRSRWIMKRPGRYQQCNLRLGNQRKRNGH
eukprot:2992848-Rhodomonas_salina.1